MDMSKKCSNKQFWLHFSAHWALSHKIYSIYLLKNNKWKCLNGTIDEITKNKINNMFMHLKMYIDNRHLNPM